MQFNRIMKTLYYENRVKPKYRLLQIRVQRIQCIGYRSLKYHNYLICTLNRLHDD